MPSACLMTSRRRVDERRRRERRAEMTEQRGVDPSAFDQIEPGRYTEAAGEFDAEQHGFAQRAVRSLRRAVRRQPVPRELPPTPRAIPLHRACRRTPGRVRSSRCTTPQYAQARAARRRSRCPVCRRYRRAPSATPARRPPRGPRLRRPGNRAIRSRTIMRVRSGTASHLSCSAQSANASSTGSLGSTAPGVTPAFPARTARGPPGVRASLPRSPAGGLRFQRRLRAGSRAHAATLPSRRPPRQPAARRVDARFQARGQHLSLRHAVRGETQIEHLLRTQSLATEHDPARAHRTDEARQKLRAPAARYAAPLDFRQPALRVFADDDGIGEHQEFETAARRVPVGGDDERFLRAW